MSGRREGTPGQILHILKGSQGHIINNLIPINSMAQMTTDKFFERHKFPKLTQEEVDHQDSPVSMEEIDGVVENLPR